MTTLPLSGGGAIPHIGYGVWRLDDDRATRLVGAAIAAGYRHIDTAQAYGNEAGVGRAIAEAPVARDALFVTSKLRTRDQGRDAARRSFDETMARLGLDVLDLFLIHWPVPQHDRYVETWQALVELQAEGRIAHIGVSNFLPAHLDRLKAETGVVPAVNQVELHPLYQQRALRDYHAQHGIVTTCYSPLGGDGADLLRDPVIAGIATAVGRTPAQVVLRWHVQSGLVPLPKTATPTRLPENIAVFDFTLSADHMAALGALDRPDGKALPHPEEMNTLF